MAVQADISDGKVPTAALKGEMEPSPSFHVKRKPVGGRHTPTPDPHAAAPGPAQDAPPHYSEIYTTQSIEKDLLESSIEERPPLPARHTAPTLGALAISAPALSWRSPTLPPDTAATPARFGPESPGFEGLNVEQKDTDGPDGDDPKSFWQTALEETRHFAGGLIPHPIESTKHYSILRHSGAIVFYRGPETSVVITIFSSPGRPLPADRSLWLQQRGYSGNTGMKLKALIGTTSTWVDVTPTLQVQASDIEATVERGWQRDIGKAVKANQGPKEHVVRETHVVRIPAAVPDGYFRILLCTGRVVPGEDAQGTSKSTKGNVLCSSPIFRIASASSDSSIFRGAKLRTVPLELGVKVASTFASNTVGNYIAPVTATVQSRLQKLQPGLVAQEAGQLVYTTSGLETKLTAAGEQYAQVRQTGYTLLQEDVSVKGDLDGLDGLVGPDEGPQKPYPLKFQGKVVRGQGRTRELLSVPTASLTDFPDDMRFNLKGVYFGWACLLPGKEVDATASLDWHEALIIAAPATSSKPSVVASTEVCAYLMYDFGATKFFGVKMKIIVMGFLHPWPGLGTPKEDLQGMLSLDSAVAMNSLSREHWGPEMTLGRMKTAKRAQTVGDRYVDARQKLQKQVDRIPVHLAGVRTAGAELRDKTHGNGGYWIPRST